MPTDSCHTAPSGREEWSPWRECLASGRLYALTAVACCAAGVAASLCQRPVYAAQAKIVDEMQEVDITLGFSSIVRTMMAPYRNNGFHDLEVYPQLARARDFLDEYGRTRVYADGVGQTYAARVRHEEESSLWRRLTARGPLTPEKLDEEMADRIGYDFNLKNYICRLEVRDADPVVAATMARRACTLLQKYGNRRVAEAYKAKRVHADSVAADARRRYLEAMRSLAAFEDSHFESRLESDRTTQERLERLAKLACDRMEEATLQSMRMKALAGQNAPLYAVLRPATVPLRKANTPAWVYALALMTIGFVGDTWYVLARKRWQIYKGGRR